MTTHLLIRDKFVKDDILVEELTNPKQGFNRVDRKRLDRQHLKHASWEAKRIKLIDRLCNVKDMKDAPQDFRQLYAEESTLLLNECLLGINEHLEQELRNAIMELQ